MFSGIAFKAVKLSHSLQACETGWFSTFLFYYTCFIILLQVPKLILYIYGHILKGFTPQRCNKTMQQYSCTYSFVVIHNNRNWTDLKHKVCPQQFLGRFASVRLFAAGKREIYCRVAMVPQGHGFGSVGCPIVHCCNMYRWCRTGGWCRHVAEDSTMRDTMTFDRTYLRK